MPPSGIHVDKFFNKLCGYREAGFSLTHSCSNSLLEMEGRGDFQRNHVMARQTTTSEGSEKSKKTHKEKINLGSSLQWTLHHSPNQTLLVHALSFFFLSLSLSKVSALSLLSPCLYFFKGRQDFIERVNKTARD